MDADEIQGSSVEYQSPGRAGGSTLLKKSASIKSASNYIMGQAGKDAKECPETGARPASSSFHKTVKSSKSLSQSQNAFTKVKSLQK